MDVFGAISLLFKTDFTQHLICVRSITFVVWRSVWTSTCPSYQQEALDCLVTLREIWLAFCLQREKSPASSLTFGVSKILSSLNGKQRIYTRNWISQRTVSGEYVVILYINSLQQQSFMKEYRNLPLWRSDIWVLSVGI